MYLFILSGRRDRKGLVILPLNYYIHYVPLTGCFYCPISTSHTHFKSVVTIAAHKFTSSAECIHLNDFNPSYFHIIGNVFGVQITNISLIQFIVNM